jgi:hypothetical protein
MTASGGNVATDLTPTSALSPTLSLSSTQISAQTKPLAANDACLSLSNSIIASSTTYSSSPSSSSSSSSFVKESRPHLTAACSLEANPSEHASGQTSQSQTYLKLTKHVENLLKSIKYLEQIVKKQKYEIVSSIVTAILEAVLDLYNQIRSLTYSSSCLAINNSCVGFVESQTNAQVHALKSSINESLAGLVKWSDAILLLSYTEQQNKSSENSDDCNLTKNVCAAKAKILFHECEVLISAFLKSLTDLVEFYRTAAESTPKTANDSLKQHNRIDALTRKQRPVSVSSLDQRLLISSGSSSLSSSFSTSASSSTQLPCAALAASGCSVTQPVITIGHTEPDGTKTIEIKTCRNFLTDPSNTNSSSIIQTNTLTTTMRRDKQLPSDEAQITIENNLTNNRNVLDLSAFLQIDKLAIELSQSPLTPSLFAASTASSTFQNGKNSNGNGTTTLSNDTCNYLVEQFESFARDFNLKKQQSEKSDAASTYSRQQTLIPPGSPQTPCDPLLTPSLNHIFSFKPTDSVSGSISEHANSSPRTLKQQQVQTATLYTKSTVTHDVDKKSSLMKSIAKNNSNTLSNKECVISKITDHETQNETNFVEENSVSDPSLAKILLNLNPAVSEAENQTINGNQSILSDTDSIDNEVDCCEVHKILFDNAPTVAKANLQTLSKPKFLVINDFDEKANDSSNSPRNNEDNPFDMVIVEGRKERVSSGEDGELFLDDDYDLEDYSDVIKAKNEDINNNHANNNCTTVADLNNNDVKNENTETKVNKTNDITLSSISNATTSSSNLSASVNKNGKKPEDKEAIKNSTGSSSNTKLDILSLLDVTHLLEYQINSSVSNTNNNTHNQSHTSLNSGSLSNSSSFNIMNTCNMTLLRGGHIDALVVLATSSHLSIRTVNYQSTQNLPSSKVRHDGSSQSPPRSLTTNIVNNTGNATKSSTNGSNSKNNFLFQEAFLTTYRTIIEPIELVSKLILRYRTFSKHKKATPSLENSSSEQFNRSFSEMTNSEDIVLDMNEKFDLNRLKINNKYNRMALLAARNSLALLVRVLDDLEYEFSSFFFYGV